MTSRCRKGRLYGTRVAPNVCGGQHLEDADVSRIPRKPFHGEDATRKESGVPRTGCRQDRQGLMLGSNLFELGRYLS
jgi:hypothetical protein